MSDTIMAADLGRFKCVVCLYRRSTRETVDPIWNSPPEIHTIPDGGASGCCSAAGDGGRRFPLEQPNRKFPSSPSASKIRATVSRLTSLGVK